MGKPALDYQFDTLDYTKELELAGFSREQSEGIAKASVKMITDRIQHNIATTADITNLRTEMQQGFQHMLDRANTEATMLDTKLQDVHNCIDRRFSIMQAEMKNHFAQYDDRFSNTDKHLVQIDKQFVQIHKKFDDIDKRFDHVYKRFDEIDKRFEQVDARFARIEAVLVEHGKEISLLKEAVNKNTHLIENLQNRLLLRLGAMMGAGFGIMTAALSVLTIFLHH